MKTWIIVCLLACGNLVVGNPLAVDRNFLGALTITQQDKAGSIFTPVEDINGTEWYKPNIDVDYKFRLDEGSYVKLVSRYFDLEYSEGCIFDSLRVIEDGVDTKFCDTDPFTYISKGNDLDLHFSSDETYQGRGFTINYVIKNKDDIPDGSCDSAIIGGDGGEIFDSGKQCFYRLESGPSQYIRMDLKMINFGSKSCEEESIKIYRGTSTHGKLLKEICAGEVGGLIKVFEDKLFIEYRRNFEEQGDRFIIDYSFVEDTLTTTPLPVTTPSPVGGDNDCSGFMMDLETGFTYDIPHYEDNRECVLVVRNNKLTNYVITVTFEDFDLEEIDNCIFDSLRVISGERHDSTSLGGPYCGTSLNRKTLVTYGNSLRLEFKTDESFSLYGFRAKINFMPRTGCICEDKTKVCVRTGYELRCLTGNKCDNNPCKNGGTCVRTRTSTQCYCRDGFTGDDCTVHKGNAGVIRFKAIPQNRVFIKGDDYVETCLVETGPDEKATYSWTLDGQLISPYSKSKGFGHLQAERFLQLDNFNEKFEGLYTCKATIGNASAEIYFEYSVVDDCLARFEAKPQDKTINIGDQAIFTCQVTGAEEVKWKRDGIELDLENLPRYSKLTDTDYLKISDVEEDDAGEYTCEAIDVNKCRSARKAQLNVMQMAAHNQYCGRSIYESQPGGKISRGRDSRPGENPWQVTMLNRNGNAFCGASVISQKYILTAAHCIVAKHFENLEDVTLVFGTTDCRGRDGVKRHPIRVIKEPNYGVGGTYNNDIALIELNEKVIYGETIRPICLQRTRFYNKMFFEERQQPIEAYGRVTGCGETRSRLANKGNMKEINMPYVSRELCEGQYEDHSDITENMFCAGFEQRYKGDACAGDSGGPLIMPDNTRWYQTGIVSFGMGCDRGFYSVFTNVGNYYDWIKGETAFDEEEVENFIV